MKKSIVLLAFCGLAALFTAHGQSLEQYKQRLQQPDVQLGSRVKIVEHDAAVTAVRTLQARPTGEKISGYRVRIFFDNSQNARSLAQSTLARFKEIYPDIPAYLDYVTPFFRVTVGNCLTSEEAIILRGRIKDTFNAFLIPQEIPLSVFGESPSAIAAETPQVEY